MQIGFRQGIVSYPNSSGAQTFMVKTGAYVSLRAGTVPVVVAFAHRDSDYLFTESQDLDDVWGPLPDSTDCWLYWDIDRQTGERTFGFTAVEPDYSPEIIPGIPDQHWFDTSTTTHYVYISGQYREVIRVFAGKVNTSTFAPLGVGFPLKPYAGSQVGIYAQSRPGHILVDNVGVPIRRTNGTFFTTESDFFTNGSPINPIRLEATVVTGEAVEMMAKFHVVKFTDFGRIALAGYNDISTTAIAMLMEDLSWEDVGNVCIQGKITNPDWNWSTVGAPLWVLEGGELTEVDPHVANAFAYPLSKQPVARVLTPTTIIFDQGLGGKGDRGEPGLAGGVALASATTYGVARLATTPADIDNPIMVGDNDPRLSNKVLKAGDTMTGPLILNANPATNLGAATKQYVDTAIQAITVPYDLTLICSDTTNVIQLKDNAAFAIAPRTFSVSSIRANLLTPSSAGNVVANILINNVITHTVTISALSESTTIAATTVVVAGNKISVNITEAGVDAIGLLITFVGAV